MINALTWIIESITKTINAIADNLGWVAAMVALTILGITTKKK